MKITITPNGIHETHGQNICEVQMPLVIGHINVGEALTALLSGGQEKPTTATPVESVQAPTSQDSSTVKALEEKVEVLTKLVETLSEGLISLQFTCAEKKACVCSAPEVIQPVQPLQEEQQPGSESDQEDVKETEPTEVVELPPVVATPVKKTQPTKKVR